MNRRMSFIMQTARLADEIGWLEHEAELARIAGAPVADQTDRLRELARRINAAADAIGLQAVKEAA